MKHAKSMYLLIIFFIAAVFMLFMPGCKILKEPEEEMTGSRPYESVQMPALPETGSSISDFIPDGWRLLDCVDLDFNSDGIADWVGVLETVLPDGQDHMYPRILFAVAGGKNGCCSLDFREDSLIRTKDEGGTFGDPYVPLTAQDTSFTTHSFGGSAWKWAENYTYTYKYGDWYLTLSENISWYGPYITEYEMNDWENGIGIFRKRNIDFNDIEDFRGDDTKPEYDIEYEFAPGEPFTLKQAADADLKNAPPYQDRRDIYGY